MPLTLRYHIQRRFLYSFILSGVCLSLISFFYIPAETNQLQYDVVRNDKIIGHLTAIRTERNNTIEYSMESSVSVDLIFEMKIYSKVSGTFSNGLLTDGKILRTVNGKDKANARFLWVRDKYFITEEKNTKEFRDKIFYTTACLMHREPFNVTKIFSENFQKFIDVKQLKPHQYVLILPDGNKNYYNYQNGICTEAQINASFTTAYFKLKR